MMGRPYKLKGQPRRADPDYLERLRTLQRARKAHNRANRRTKP